jgi:phage terminase small subunit
MWLCDQVVGREGHTLLTAANGPVLHPMVKLRLSLSPKQLALAREFGFTPAARNRIGAPEAADDPKAEAWQAA